MGIFISVPKTVECVLTAVLLSVLMCAVTYRQAGVLQSCGYDGGKYFGWVKKKGNRAFSRYSLLALMCALGSAVLGLCFAFTGEWSAVISLVVYLLFCVVYLWADAKSPLRSHAVLTPRFLRLYAVYFFILLVLSYILITLLNFADNVWGKEVFSCIRYCPLAILPLLAIPLLVTANAVAKIYEVPHNGKYIKKAKASLAKSDIKVVGITGSYGKTGTKFILSTILSEKYKVFTTPRSHNTPIGIALAVNSHNLSDYDIFIAEMGARHLGDIAELCSICPPDLALITGICGQHLETFETFGNIIKAKGEILENSGKAIIADDCFELFASYPIEKTRANCVSEVLPSSEGTKFTLTLGGEKREARTKLLGAHSAYNIGLAAEAAYALGMTLDEIVAGIEKIEYIEHRLQPIESNGVHILDDGYNSNVKGARAALEVLKLFEGSKIVVTPGLVELGVLEYDENFALGRELVSFDYIILVGDTLVKAIKDGFDDAGGAGEKIVVLPTLAAAQEKLKEVVNTGDAVLFLNDLPDIY